MAWETTEKTENLGEKQDNGMERSLERGEDTERKRENNWEGEKLVLLGEELLAPRKKTLSSLKYFFTEE